MLPALVLMLPVDDSVPVTARPVEVSAVTPLPAVCVIELTVVPLRATSSQGLSDPRLSAVMRPRKDVP